MHVHMRICVLKRLHFVESTECGMQQGKVVFTIFFLFKNFTTKYACGKTLTTEYA